MEQHAVPQNVTTYKFRLVGDMTLQQFLELAAGLVVAWIIFNSKINFLLKWIFGPFAAFFGFALAFIPIDDRPLHTWLVNFFKAIYSPTQFIYRQQPKPLDFFTSPPVVPVDTLVKAGQTYELEEYLKTLPPSTASSFDLAEKKYLEYINSLFGALGINQKPLRLTDPSPLQNPIKSNIGGVRIRQLLHPQMCLLPHATIYQSEPKQAAIPAFSANPPAPTAPSPNRPQPQTPPSGKNGAPVASRPKTAAVMKNPALQSQPQPKPQPKPAAPAPATTSPSFAPDIVLPQKPDRPNLVCGITLDKTGKIIPNVIIEIKDQSSLPVRALKSNKLGQFFIATPLADGVYQIQAEHQSHKFAIIKLDAKGEIIPPLKIQAI